MVMEIHECFVLLEIPQHVRSKSSQHDARKFTSNLMDRMFSEETMQSFIDSRHHSGKRPLGTNCFMQQISR